MYTKAGKIKKKIKIKIKKKRKKRIKRIKRIKRKISIAFVYDRIRTLPIRRIRIIRR